MISLLVIADDFTGAMDTGVQLSKAGIKTLVCASPDFDWPAEESAVQVLSVNTESRHITPEKAYSIVKMLTEKAIRHSVPCIYKKVDSMLRGNLSAELAAVLDATGEAVLPFAPAYPKNGRTTENGQLCVNGVPFSPKSTDPFSPVDSADIASILSPLPVHPATVKTPLPNGVALFNAKTDADLQEIARFAERENATRILSGCAGFASMLPNILHLQGRIDTPHIPGGKFLLISGSLHPNTLAQIEALRKSGVPVQYMFEENAATVPSAQKALQKSEILAVSTVISPPQGNLSEESRLAARETISAFAKELLEAVTPSVLVIVGGDTLSGIMEKLSITSVQPLCELLPGVVLGFTPHRKQFIVTKSGGFGDANTLKDTLELLTTYTEQKGQTK